MRDEPLFDWRRDGFSQRTKIEFSMGISELIKQATGQYVPLPGTELDALLDECLMKEIGGIEREARAEGAREERERLYSKAGNLRNPHLKAVRSHIRNWLRSQSNTEK